MQIRCRHMALFWVNPWHMLSKAKQHDKLMLVKGTGSFHQLI